MRTERDFYNLISTAQRWPQAMNRDRFVFVLEYLTGGPYANESLEQRDQTEKDWAKASIPKWFDILKDIMLNPPPEAMEPDGTVYDGWESTVDGFLGRMVEKYPEEGLSEIAPFLSQPAFRERAVNILAYAGPASLPLLRPFVSNIEELSEAEVEGLCDALSIIKDKEAQRLLQDIRQAVPDRAVVTERIGAQRLHELIEFYINPLTATK